MAEQVFPTKGNLIKSKRRLKQAQLGYELMDRKRNILVREMVSLTDEAKELRVSIDSTYSEAYRALQHANTTLGVVSGLAETFPAENSLKLSVRSVMGVELPKISADIEPVSEPVYPMSLTNSAFDYAYICFNKAKEITVRLAEVENSIYRLAVAIKKTQKRANALKNIMIPRFQNQVSFITNALEEKEREEFSRQKVIKRRKTVDSV
ncbi:MAG: V-type ATP synthase subunit D [Lachnospiraceae bacterium]|nr:V-type ATP synthase subunit D [Ruminococcus sp.]MCM1276542.1 V-type ATP synthase subunit D [Lachnospiraceae bacterium]